MEWVETTAKNVEEAKELALDRLGVAEDEAEFEVLEEPKTGLFGRVRGEARVRARVRPAAVRPKQDRRQRGRSRDKRDGERRPAAGGGIDTDLDAGAETDHDAVPDAVPDTGSGTVAAGEGLVGTGEPGSTSSRESRPRRERARRSGERPDRSDRSDHTEHPERSTRQQRSSNESEQEEAAMSDGADGAEAGGEAVDPRLVGEAAVTFMDGLVAAFGMDATTTLDVDGVDLDVRVDGEGLGLLVGPGGRTLLAVQDLARVASQRRLGDHETRLRVDVAGYRERRRAALEKFAVAVAHEVAETQRPRALEPMPSADRKVIHDVVIGIEGVTSRSEGDDPVRRVVITPA